VLIIRSCDTEDWSNDDKFRNKLHFTIYSHRKHMIYIIIIFDYFYCIFDQTNAALMSRRDRVCVCVFLKQIMC